MIKGFAKYDYDCIKIVRELKIMRGLKDNSPKGVCNFIPELLDVIIPPTSTPGFIFLIMEHE